MKKINVGFFVVVLILIVFSYFYVTVYSKYDVMLYLSDYKEIIQLNRLIEILLLVTISFSLYKIFFRRNYVFGSIITKKIFLLLASVIVIPSLINIKIANYFIDNTVNRLFNPQIEELFDNSFNIAEESIKYFSKELRKKSVIAGEYLKLVKKEDEQADLIKLRNILDVSAISIYNLNGKIVLQDKPNDQKYFITNLPQYVVAKIKSSGYYYEINKDNSGNYLFYYYQFYENNRIIALTQIAPDFIRVDNTKLVQNKDLYLGLLNNKDHLKDVYTSTLIISVLLSITIAVLLSMFFSQYLIKRISNLIENIESIKQGLFQNNNSFQGKDELSQLINSFNEMSHNLDRVRRLEKFQKDQITEYKNYLENLINNVSLSIIVFDEDFNVKNVNLITAEILDIDLESLENINIDLWSNTYPNL